MIYRFFPLKDTFISNRHIRSVPQTGSNYGYAESLEVFKIAGISGAQGTSSGSQLGRVLLQFSTAALDTFISSNNLSTKPRFFYLRLQNETTDEALPQSFDLDVIPVSGNWDEGRGMDTSDLRDRGYANWWKRTSTDYWASRGGDMYHAYHVTQHFDEGDENLDIDVTSIFNLWSSGTIQNNGICVKLTATLEADTVYDDYHLKSFYSRHSQWTDRRPYVEARWDDFIGDDRGRMRWGRTGSIFFHNIVDGQYQNLSIGSNALIVRIADASGTLMSVTASNVGMVGVYSASFALPTGSYSGSVFYDRWGSGSFAFMTGSFMFQTQAALPTIPSREYIARVANLRDFYEPDEVARFDVYVRRKNYRPSVVATASIDVRPEVIERCFYAIENESTRERIIPFGTGSLQHTRLSYDYNGNYFIFPMSNLHSGEVYRVLFLVEKDGFRQVLDNDVKFRVR